MPKYDFSKNPDEQQNFKIPSPGKYLAKVVDINLRYTSNGDEMWSLTFEIVDPDGEFDRCRVYDNLIFSAAAASRAKIIFKAFGVPIDREYEYQFEDIFEKFCHIVIEGKRKYTAKNGFEKEKAIISFDGFLPIETYGKAPNTDKNEIPY